MPLPNIYQSMIYHQTGEDQKSLIKTFSFLTYEISNQHPGLQEVHVDEPQT